MGGTIHKVDDSNVYEHLMMMGGERAYLDAAAMAAGYSPIFPDDPQWSEMATRHLDDVADLCIDGLEVIGLARDGKCVGLCGYRMLSGRHILVHRHEVELPYELFMVVDDDEEMSTAMVHAAQLFIANHEGLRIMQLAR